jgi:hypothetical protein
LTAIFAGVELAAAGQRAIMMKHRPDCDEAMLL